MACQDQTFAHAGPHGNDECIVTIGKAELRLSGYQFKGRNPDRHYCRHYPYLGQTIIKIDSLTDDLSNMAIEIQLYKLNSWLKLLISPDEAFSVIKQQPKQYFAKQLVSIESDIQDRNVYAMKFQLYDVNGVISKQTFFFLIGFPFAQMMVAIAISLLLFITFIFFRQLKLKRQEQ